MNAYQERRNAAWLADQAPAVQKIAKHVLTELHNLEQCLYWALDPEEKDTMRDQWTSSMIEHAHALIDLGHDYRAAVKANPPPKEFEDDSAA